MFYIYTKSADGMDAEKKNHISKKILEFTVTLQKLKFYICFPVNKVWFLTKKIIFLMCISCWLVSLSCGRGGSTSEKERRVGGGEEKSSACFNTHLRTLLWGCHQQKHIKGKQRKTKKREAINKWTGSWVKSVWKNKIKQNHLGSKQRGNGAGTLVDYLHCLHKKLFSSCNRE